MVREGEEGERLNWIRKGLSLEFYLLSQQIEGRGAEGVSGVEGRRGRGVKRDDRALVCQKRKETCSVSF